VLSCVRRRRIRSTAERGRIACLKLVMKGSGVRVPPSASREVPANRPCGACRLHRQAARTARWQRPRAASKLTRVAKQTAAPAIQSCLSASLAGNLLRPARVSMRATMDRTPPRPRVQPVAEAGSSRASHESGIRRCVGLRRLQRRCQAGARGLPRWVRAFAKASLSNGRPP
jgi:hypothetical protein